MGMNKKVFYKVVCETIDVFEKNIVIDKNCKNLDEVHNIVVSHPELQQENMTWILYPMSVIENFR